MNMNRREFVKLTAAAATGPFMVGAAEQNFRLRYALASSMYGTLDLSVILPQVRKIGADAIDLWPLKHGNQREQVEAMRHEKFAQMLGSHGVRLGVSTRYDLSPEQLPAEIAFLKKLGGSVLVTGSGGPKGLKGDELKSAVRQLAEKLKPAIAAAEQAGLTIGIENHGNSVIDSPDSIRWLVEAAPSKHLGVALAPYHLPQDASLIARLIESLGDRLALFYAWQHGMGCMVKLPKEQELLQLPGRGPLDFTPLLAALKKIHFQGYTEIFMHPVPRGIPILETAQAVTQEINRSRAYLDQCLENL